MAPHPAYLAIRVEGWVVVPVGGRSCRLNQERVDGSLPPIKFPRSPEWWRDDEALQAEAQAPQAPREQGHQAAGNVSGLRPRGLFSAGLRFATASHMPVDTAQ